MVNSSLVVHVLSEDGQIRERFCAALGGTADRITAWSFPAEFMKNARTMLPGVLILDHCMLQMSGLEVYKKLRGIQRNFATILILSEPRIDVAVKAVRLGITNVLCIPTERETVCDAVSEAAQRLDRIQREEQLLPPLLPGGRTYLSLLTRREGEVVQLVCDGATNKKISMQLGICRKTVERHRSNAMKKMRVTSVAGLTRLVNRDEQLMLCTHTEAGHDPW